MQIDDQMIEYVAALAKLKLTEQEKERAKVDLSEIIGYMDCMETLDTSKTEPMSHVLALENVMREDEVTSEWTADTLLSNAPKQKDHCFVVPKTVE